MVAATSTASKAASFRWKSHFAAAPVSQHDDVERGKARGDVGHEPLRGVLLREIGRERPRMPPVR